MGKLGTLVIVWVFVVIAYILIGTMMPAYKEITDEVSTQIHTTANTDQQPGVVGAVESFPVYIWLIPGALGILTTVYILKYSDSVNRYYRRD